MKRKIIGILVVTLLIGTIVLPVLGAIDKINEGEYAIHDFNEVLWNITIDRGEFDDIRYVEQTDDGEYICCGLTEENNMFYVYMLKIKLDGSVNWSVINYNLNASLVTGPRSHLYAYYVIPTNVGYLVAGWSMTNIDVQGDIAWAPTAFLWKTDSTGTTEWIKHYYDLEKSALYFLYHVLETIDGYITSGIEVIYNEYGELLNWNGALMKMDIDGNLIWQQTYDTGGNEQLSALCSTSDGGYLQNGFLRDNDQALWIVKTDSNGNEEWNKSFDGPGLEYSYTVDCYQTSDSGYIMCGFTNSYGAGRFDGWVVKTDASGNMDWNKTYGGVQDDESSHICRTSDGSYVVAIQKNSNYPVGTKDDIWLVKITEDGYTEWSYLIEEEYPQIPSCVHQTSDGGFIISGHTRQMGQSLSDGILYKLSAIENQRPDKPTMPEGSSEGKPDTEYTFTTSTTDPDGDQVSYLWDWGDGNFTEGANEESHVWTTEDNFEIRVMAIDEHGGESEWSDPLAFSTPRTKIFNPWELLIKSLIERFPRLELLFN